jgi:hypothetical protein
MNITVPALLPHSLRALRNASLLLPLLCGAALAQDRQDKRGNPSSADMQRAVDSFFLGYVGMTKIYPALCQEVHVDLGPMAKRAIEINAPFFERVQQIIQHDPKLRTVYDAKTVERYKVKGLLNERRALETQPGHSRTKLVSLCKQIAADDEKYLDLRRRASFWGDIAMLLAYDLGAPSPTEETKPLPQSVASPTEKFPPID